MMANGQTAYKLCKKGVIIVYSVSFIIWGLIILFGIQRKMEKNKWFIEWNETIPKTIKEAQRPQ